MLLAVPRRISLFVFPGFDILDLGGVAAVFAEPAIGARQAYCCDVISAAGGEVVSSSGLPVKTTCASGGPIDTLVVLGGAFEAVREPADEVIGAVLQHAPRARRVAGTCTGAFLLGHAGLLDGKRATTHWQHGAELQSLFPPALVEPDRIFVHDGNLWTSAGGAAVIDLALALVEEDLGIEAARNAARALVVYSRRQGGQSQHSTLIELEPPSDRIRRALTFAREHLSEPLTVSRLAQHANLSERQFGRAFRAATGLTPARAVERLRAEAARPLVEESRQTLDEISRSVGFSDAEQMRQAFLRSFGQPPQSVRRLSRQGAPVEVRQVRVA